MLNGGRERGTGDTGNRITPGGVRYEYHRIIQEKRPPWVSVEDVA